MFFSLILSWVLIFLSVAEGSNIGDYVAAGLGLSSTETSSSAARPFSVAVNNTATWSNSTSWLTTSSSAKLSRSANDGISSSQRASMSTNVSRVDGSGHGAGGSLTVANTTAVATNSTSSNSLTTDAVEHSTSGLSTGTASSIGPVSHMTTASRNVSTATGTDHGAKWSSTAARVTGNINVHTGNRTGNILGTVNSTQSTSNHSMALSGDCWQQWNEYWSAGFTTSTVWYGSEVPITDTIVFQNYFGLGQSYTAYVDPATTSTWIETPVAEDGPDHVLSTYTTTVVVTYSRYVDFEFSLTTTTSTQFVTSLESGVSGVGSYGPSVWGYGASKPNCTLPSTVIPDCQAQWNTYIANNGPPTGNPYLMFTVPRPSCTQASIPSADCSSLINGYYYQWTSYGFEGNAGWSYTDDGSSSYWPSTKSFAPGCSLGCQTCAITGETVKLMYWPSATGYPTLNGTATAGFVDQSANASQPVTTAIDGTVLTSPTVYVSYDKLYASNSCHGIGKTYYNAIIAITDTNDLSSMEYVGMFENANEGRYTYTTLSFNLTDLNEPVPASIYNRQPRCMKSAAYVDCLESTCLATFNCATMGPYAPIIAVPMEVTQLDPASKSCTAYYGGLYDPPKALQPATTVAGVSLQAGHSASASPGSTVAPATPSKTATTLQTTASSAPARSSGEIPQPMQASQAQSEPSNDGHSSSPTDPSSAYPEDSDSDLTRTASTAVPAFRPSNVVSDPAATGNFAASSPPGQTPGPSEDTAAVQTAQVLPNLGATTSGDPSAAGSAVSPLKGSLPTETSALQHSPVGDSQTRESALAADPLISAIGVIAASLTQVAKTFGTVLAGTSKNNVDPLVSLIGEAAESSGAVAGPTAEGGSDPDHTTFEAQATSPVVATIGSDSAAITASPMGRSIVVAMSGTSTVLTAGQAAILAGHTVSAASDGAGVVYDGSRTVQLVPADTITTVGAIVTGAQGQTMFVSRTNSELHIVAGGSTATLQAGETTVYDGRTFSAAQAGASYAVLDGSSTLSLYAADTLAHAATAQITGSQGQQVQVVNEGGNFFVADGQPSIVLGAGQTATFDGKTLGAAQSGSYFVVDGSTTMTMDAAASSSTAVDATITGSQGQTVQISNQDGNLVAADGSSSITISAGQVAVFDGKTLSAAAAGSYLVVDGTSTLAVGPDNTLSSGESTITGAQGQNIEISEVNDGIEVQDGISFTTLAAGQAATFDGRTISADAGASYVVIDGSSTLRLSTDSAAQSTITGIGGQAVRITDQNGEIGLADGTTTAMLRPGDVTTFDGRTVSAGPGGSFAVVDGTSTVNLHLYGTFPAAASTITGVGGQTIAISDETDGEVEIADGSSTVTLQDGRATTVDDRTISAGAGGSYVVIDGSRTMSLARSTASSVSQSPLDAIASGQAQGSSRAGPSSTKSGASSFAQCLMIPPWVCVAIAIVLSLVII